MYCCHRVKSPKSNLNDFPIIISKGEYITEHFAPFDIIKHFETSIVTQIIDINALLGFRHIPADSVFYQYRNEQVINPKLYNEIELNCSTIFI